MSTGQQQQPPPRRATNVGSLLLTPQENESLFTFLGKKCVVSGRDPRRHRRRSLTGPGLVAGKWEWGRRRERRGEGPLPAWPTPGPPPRSLGASGAGRGRRTPPPELPGSGERRLRRPALEPRSAGSAPSLLVQTLLGQAPARFSSCKSCWILLTGPLPWPSLHPLALDLHNTKGFRRV